METDMEDYVNFPQSSFPNNDLDSFPFPVLSGNNSIYKVLEYSDLFKDKSKDTIAHAAIQESNANAGRAKILSDWARSSEERIIDIDTSARVSVLKNVTKLEMCVSKWRYICASEGEPFRHCICGEVVAIQHCIQHIDYPDKVLYMGLDCCEVFYGTNIHTISESIEKLLDDPSQPCGKSLLELVTKFKIIDDNERRALMNELTVFRKFGSTPIRFSNYNDICQQLKCKFKIAQKFIRGSLFEKFRYSVITILHELVVVLNSESCILSDKELVSLKANYWKQSNLTDEYASLYQSICEQRANGKPLSGAQQKALEVFMNTKMGRIDEKAIDFIRFKADFILKKAQILDKIKTGVHNIIEEVVNVKQGKLGEFIDYIIHNEPKVLSSGTPVAPNHEQEDPKNLVKQLKQTEKQTSPKLLGKLPDAKPQNKPVQQKTKLVIPTGSDVPNNNKNENTIKSSNINKSNDNNKVIHGAISGVIPDGKRVVKASEPISHQTQPEQEPVQEAEIFKFVHPSVKNTVDNLQFKRTFGSILNDKSTLNNNSGSKTFTSPSSNISINKPNFTPATVLNKNQTLPSVSNKSAINQHPVVVNKPPNQHLPQPKPTIAPNNTIATDDISAFSEYRTDVCTEFTQANTTSEQDNVNTSQDDEIEIFDDDIDPEEIQSVKLAINSDNENQYQDELLSKCGMSQHDLEMAFEDDEQIELVQPNKKFKI